MNPPDWEPGPFPVPYGYGSGLPSPTRCPGCGLHEAEIANSTNVGCELCYETFPHVLSPIIWEYQGSTVHHGHSPQTAQLRLEARISTYQEAIEKAEEEGRQDEAAVLQDLLRLLRPEED